MIYRDITQHSVLRESSDRTLTLAVFAFFSSENSSEPEAHSGQMIRLMVSAADEHGCPINGLKAQDFEVTTITGTPITVSSFTEDTHLSGNYQLQITLTQADSAAFDTLLVDVRRPEAGLHGRGIVRLDVKTHAL